MSTAQSRQNLSRIASEVSQAARMIHRQDIRARYAVEVGVIGLVIMVAMSFSGGGSGSGQSANPGSASYNPAPAVPSGSSSQSGLTITQQDLNKLKQPGGNVISAVPIAPTKVNPIAMEGDSVQVEPEQTESSDPFTFKGSSKAPKPLYQDSQ